jgi:peptidoglycan/LPS O-acetylase OafA/YrhL
MKQVMTGRRHDIDTLRVMAFSLLILYHAGMVYVLDWGFHIKSPHQWEWLQWPMVSLNRWRMDLIFLISGIALGLSRAPDQPWRMAVRRTGLLLIPLIFGMLAIVPIQAWVEARSNGTFEAGFGAFLLRYWQLRPWAEAGFAGAEFGITWNHLWYLAYLWVYSLALVPLLLLAGLGRAMGISLNRPWAGSALWPLLLIVVPTVGWFAVIYWLEPIYGDTKALFGDWANHAKFFPVFLFGFVIARNEAFWAALMASRYRVLAVAAFGFAVYFGLRILGRAITPETAVDLPDWNWRAISDAGHAIYAWSALLSILAFGAVWLNKPWAWLPLANRAVYPWYILHQSLIVPLAYLLIGWNLPGPLEALGVILGTLLGCALLVHGVILRFPWLWPLFGVQLSPVRHRLPIRPGLTPDRTRHEA